MTLKDELIKKTKEAVKEKKKIEWTEQRKGITKNQRKARRWAESIIRDLPKQMKETAEEGMGRVIIEFDQNNYEGHYGINIVKEWTKKEGLKSRINGMGNGLVVEWSSTEEGKYYE